MGYIITNIDFSLFGGHYIFAHITDDGTIVDNSAGWQHVLGHITSDGTIVDNSAGWKHVLGHITSDGTIVDNSAGWKHVLGRITSDGTIVDNNAGWKRALGYINDDKTRDYSDCSVCKSYNYDSGVDESQDHDSNICMNHLQSTESVPKTIGIGFLVWLIVGGVTMNADPTGIAVLIETIIIIGFVIGKIKNILKK